MQLIHTVLNVSSNLFFNFHFIYLYVVAKIILNFQSMACLSTSNSFLLPSQFLGLPFIYRISSKKMECKIGAGQDPPDNTPFCNGTVNQQVDRD